jgi:hypothetical protein
VSAGVREATYASASANVATAGRVTQVQARLDNFNGGDAGTATVEQKMSTIASNVTGLSAEYTLKVDAGGIFGGVGLSAHLPADPTKPGYSMFLIAVDRFAMVFPGNVGGADAKRIPFGIDANGVYFNSDVYLKGNMRIEGGQKTLIAGLRGSLSIGIMGAGWSDSAARQAIWTALGNGGSATTNNHLVIGDSVTVTSSANPTSGTTKYWNDTSWSVPGVVVTGDMVLDGAFAATKIDTRGLTIKDAYGNVIFGAGANLSVNYINGLGALARQSSVDYSSLTGYKPPTNADNTASNYSAGINDQGALATQNYVNVGSTVRFPDGSVMETRDFVSRLSRINSATISTFIDGAAITNAYIGNAAIKSANIENAAIGNAQIANLSVDTIKIAGNAVTASNSSAGPGSAYTSIYVPSGQVMKIICMVYAGIGDQLSYPHDGGFSVSFYNISANVLTTAVQVETGNDTYAFRSNASNWTGYVEAYGPGTIGVSVSAFRGAYITVSLFGAMK